MRGIQSVVTGDIAMACHLLKNGCFLTNVTIDDGKKVTTRLKMTISGMDAENFMKQAYNTGNLDFSREVLHALFMKIESIQKFEHVMGAVHTHEMGMGR